MSYYFVIVGTRDNPLYTADLASKPSTSSGPASFFSSSSSSTTTSAATSTSDQKSNATSSQDEPFFALGSSSGAGGGGSGGGGGGGLFGFGGALGALAGGLSSSSSTTGATSSASSRAGGASSHPTSSTSNGLEEGKGIGFGRYNDRHVLQMIAHSSLDVVEDKQFSNGMMYMKAVDRINEWTTSAFLVPGNVKFLILHEHKHDDGIRNFFLDIWELWVKIVQNPFHDLNAPIVSSSFDAKVKASARKHL